MYICVAKIIILLFRDDIRSMMYDNRAHGFPLNFLYTEFKNPVAAAAKEGAAAGRRATAKTTDYHRRRYGQMLY
jgi:hypothetical protein